MTADAYFKSAHMGMILIGLTLSPLILKFVLSLDLCNTCKQSGGLD